jgi:hypothetical protein
MKKMLVTILSIASLAACNKTKTQCVSKPIDKSTLSGTWIEYNYGNPKISAFAHTMYKFQFYGDSFHMQTWNVTDILTVGNCSQNPHYEYAKGSWTLQDKQFHIKGIYTSDTYGTKTDSCFQSGGIEYMCYLATCNDTLEFDLPEKSSSVQPRRLHKE